MSSLSANQGVQKDSDAISGSFDSSTFIKKVTQTLRIQDLEAENEFLKSKILHFHKETAETAESAGERNKIADEKRDAEKEKEKREMVTTIAILNSQINAMCDRINDYQHKYNDMESNLKTLEENYQPNFDRLVKNLKIAIDEGKLATKEYHLLKNKEESFGAREKELEKKIQQLEEENKAKTERISELSKENINKIVSPQIYMRKTPTINQDDDAFSALSSLTSCYSGTFKAEANKRFKYCGTRSSVHESLTYRHLHKTRTSVAMATDTESSAGKRKREWPEKF